MFLTRQSTQILFLMAILTSYPLTVSSTAHPSDSLPRAPKHKRSQPTSSATGSAYIDSIPTLPADRQEAQLIGTQIQAMETSLSKAAHCMLKGSSVTDIPFGLNMLAISVDSSHTFPTTHLTDEVTASETSQFSNASGGSQASNPTVTPPSVVSSTGQPSTSTISNPSEPSCDDVG